MATQNVSDENLTEIYDKLVATINQAWHRPSANLPMTGEFQPPPRVVGKVVMTGEGVPINTHMNHPPSHAQRPSMSPPPTQGRENGGDGGSQPSDEDEQAAEARHFREVCQAFATYEEMALPEIQRIERNFKSLTEAEAALLQTPIDKRITALKNAVARNQYFLNHLVSQDLDIVDYQESCNAAGDQHCVCHGNDSMHYAATSDPIEPGCAIEDNEVSSMNMYKVRSTLKQFAREWSAERAEERAATFGPLIAALHKYKPLEAFIVEHGRRPWVLCPGSGLGRLPFDVVCQGYSCQGNEFSYFMLLGSNFILNHALEPNSLSIMPFCLNSSNRRESEDHLQTILIPDVSTADAVADDVEFSMCAGDFVEVYGGQSGAWDAVLTCFFIDTAKNIILYIHTIADIIPPGGLWANVGPLLYHFADSPTEISIELPWDEIRSIIVRYFDIVEEKWIDSFYTTHPRSMLQALYHCVSFAAIRNETPVEPHFLRENS